MLGPSASAVGAVVGWLAVIAGSPILFGQTPPGATVALQSLPEQDLTEPSIDPTLYQELRYRLIGPFRGGRTVGAVGVPEQPNVFYVGVNNGGVWKTDDSGRTWNPIFDDAPTGSVGDIAVAPSNPEVIWVGTGEGLHRPDLSTGDGIYRSTDGGRSWRHVGLSDIQQVGRIVVHPDDPDTAFVAGLGHPYGANQERGVFRTTDGGGSWDKVLYVDANTGAIQVELDPSDPRVVYAVLWEHREGPWENAAFSGAGSGLYKSNDGGGTWRRLGRGLPGAEQGLGRIGIGIAPSEPGRIYATVDARDGDAGPGGGIYRSDDAGENWRRVHVDRRLWGRGGDFAEIRVHPRDPDVVFVGNVASYRSDDGGASWTAIKGAPGGDDYHRIWINPLHPEIMLFATDQGATITVNGGRTWSSWYNQPTAQLYHVTTDRQFPYWVYGGQQESGAIAVASRGPGGQISFRDWIGVGADEYAYIAPDPRNPDIVYGGRVVRFDRRTGQSQNVAPEALRSGSYRMLRTMPLMFHPADPTMLLFATNVLWKTHTGGRDWQVISPDLSREQTAVPESIGDFRPPELETMPRRGVIYALGPSPLEVGTIWAGTDDGLVHLTRDGGANWRDVTPPELRAWDKVSQIDASRFEGGVAYVAVNAIRRDDQRPHVWRTRDYGATWKRVVSGLDPSAPVNVVRADSKRPGLLFAGTERSVSFSLDDGETWHSLRQNLPPSSVRDLVVHDDDLVVGTHGRSIWILDDLSPLRELAALTAAAGSSAPRPHLFAPAVATRVRFNLFADTPLPPEEPTGANPPDGAVLDYLLQRTASAVVLEILGPGGEVVRRYASADPPEVIDPERLPHPTYWIRPPQRLATEPGHHRFVWDLRYEPPRGARRSFSIAAVERNTPTGPLGPLVAPGVYRVRLTVRSAAAPAADGEVTERSLSVRLDPRVQISDQDLELQTRASMACYSGYRRLQEIREAIEGRLAGAGAEVAEVAELRVLLGEGEPEDQDILYGSIRASAPDAETVVGLQGKSIYLLNLVQGADARPTDQALAAIRSLSEAVESTARRWAGLR